MDQSYQHLCVAWMGVSVWLHPWSLPFAPMGKPRWAVVVVCVLASGPNEFLGADRFSATSLLVGPPTERPLPELGGTTRTPKII